MERERLVALAMVALDTYGATPFRQEKLVSSLPGEVVGTRGLLRGQSAMSSPAGRGHGLAAE